MTHIEYTKQVTPVVPCAAWHLTFEGRCLNCGYAPRGNHIPQAARLNALNRCDPRHHQ